MSLDREEYFFTPRYTRGQICKSMGVTKDTLRHYEGCGLIEPKEDPKNKYKYYSIADLEILNVVLFLRAMDIPIQEIPKFIQCKDIDTYGSFLKEQIEAATRKIAYWTNIKNLLTYLEKTLDTYKNEAYKISLVENTAFKFRVAKFDYKNYDIEKMIPSSNSTSATTHVIKLKIVDEKWILSNREDTTGMVIGHLCNEEEEGEDIIETIIPKAIMINTLEPLEQLPKTILQLREKYENKYVFDSKAYFVEHTFFNIFNQEALLRNIYLPIFEEK